MVEMQDLSYCCIPKTTARVNSLMELLELRARLDDGRPAYTFLADGETEGQVTTYGMLDQQARAVASTLMQHAAQGDRALLLYPPGLDFLPAFFGCVYSKIVAVPAYPPHRNRNLLRLQAIIRDARPKLVLTTSALLPKIHKAMAESEETASIPVIATDEAAANRALLYERPPIGRETIAFLQYTSGSTGNPKGVMLTHENLLHNAALVHHAVEHRAGDSYVTWLPVFHDMGFMAGVLQPLYGGMPCVQMAPAAFLEQPLRWLKAITKYKATTSGGPNFAYELCLRKISESERGELDLSSWTVAFNGAEPVRGETLERFTATFRSCGFSEKVFYPCYGLAEATLMVTGSWKSLPVTITAFEKKAMENDRVVAQTETGAAAQTLVGCGRALPDQQIAIANPHTLSACSPEEIGEVWVKGPSVGKGYWNHPKESQEIFHAYLSESNEGPFLRTGDLGFFRNGQLFVTGRLKDLVIIRGQNHYPQDIELTVERCDSVLHPGGGAAFSIDVNGEERLVVVQEAANRQDSDLDKTIQVIRQGIAERHELAAYAVVLIRTGTVPKTSSGKIQRRACKAAFLNQELHVLKSWQEDETTSADEPQKIAEDDATSRADDPAAAWLMAEISRKTGISPTQIKIHEPVTSYGLDSLSAIELVHKLQVGFGIDLKMADLFESLTIADIASAARAASPGLLEKAESESNTYPLSHGQRALWFLYEMAPDSAAYNIARAVRIKLVLNIDLLHNAFQQLVKRHTSLRTIFTSSEGKPVQIVKPRQEVCFEHLQVHAWTEQQLQEELVKQSHAPFNLTEGPLFRIKVYSRSGNDHVLHIAAHHIVTDFWSLMLMLDELGTLYAAHGAHSEERLEGPQRSYADFVAWQQKQISGPEGEQSWSYWKEELSREIPLLSLPLDYPRPAVQTFRGATCPFAINGTLLSKLKAISAKQQTTLFMTLLAAFQVLLHRITGQKEIIVGSPSAGRPRAEFAHVTGYFVNPLPLRGELSRTETFTTFLAQIRKKVLGAFANESYPFSLIVEKLGISRDLSSSPVFQSMFVFQKSYGSYAEEFVRFAVGQAGARMKLGELELESLSYEEQVAQFDLTLTLGEGAEGLAGAWQYNRDLFEASTVGRWAESFQLLLEAIVAHPETQVGQLAIIPEQQQRRLIEEFNRTELKYAREQCLHQQIEQQAARTPERTAVVWGEVELSYGELERRANQMAHYLRSQGVKREELVGICMRRSAGMVIAMLGIWKSGAAYVPLDAEYPEQRLRLMLEDTGAGMVISEEHLRERVQGNGVRVVCVDGEKEEIGRQSSAPVKTEVSSGQVAYVIYTSGSTGRPKGVLLEHGNGVSFVKWAKQAFGAEEFSGMLASTSICFDLSVFEIWGTLSCGGTVVLADNVLAWWERAREEEGSGQQRVRLVNTVPSAMAKLLQGGGLPESVQTVNLAGEALNEGLVEEIYRRGKVKQVNNLYGPTETTTYSSWTRVSAGQKVSIGAGVGNTQLYVLDEEMELAPLGVLGELYIGGRGVARGYWKQPGMTAERFVPNPYSGEEGVRMYRTGDLVRWREDGQLEYVGRADQQVKVRGYRIELGEIEAVLSRHEGLQESAVVVKERGGDKRLVGYAVARAGAEVTEEEVRSYLQQQLPHYMVPGQIVMLEGLAKTSNGKVDRKALPEPGRAEVGGRGPKDEVEEKIGRIWAEVLQVERVGMEEDFFRLGGHSLLATQIVARVEEQFQVRMPLRRLFESPTVAAMAAEVSKAIQEKHTSAQVPLTRVSRDGNPELSFAQQRLWFLEQLQPNSAMYNIPMGIEIKGRCDHALIGEALNQIVRRHESLRTVFPSVQGHPVQLIRPFNRFELPVTDLGCLTPSERKISLKKIKSLEAEMPFNLQYGPLLRTRLVRLGDEKHLLFITMHHIVSDGPSIEILLQEFVELYHALSTNVPPRLEDLAFQYVDFAYWQRRLIQSEAIESELEYWRKQLQDCRGVLELPTDHAWTPNSGLKSGIQEFQLSRAITDKLRELAHKNGATLFMIVQAALKVLLFRLSGQTDINVGIPISSRTGKHAEKLIGLFSNTLVLRDSVQLGASFRSLLQAVRETTLEAYAHQNVPFERLVEELRPERSLRHSPFFQVMLAFQQSLLRETQCGNLSLRPFLLDNGTSKFNLTLMMGEGAEGLAGAWQYNRDLFEASTVGRWAESFQLLLEAIVAHPETQVGQLAIIPEQQQRRLIEEFNRTELKYAREQCLHQQIEQQAARTPERTAVVWGEVELSYGELERRANQMAHYLRSQGVKREELVGICMRRSAGMVIAMLGIWKSGAAYVPLDAEYPEQRLRLMLEDTGAGMVISEEHLRERVQGNGVRVVCVDGEKEEIGRQSSAPVKTEVSSGQVAYVIYTSGSTGRPKGVLLEHGNGVSFVKWAKQAFGAEEFSGMLASTSICFDLSVFEIWGTLSCGGTVVLADNVLAWWERAREEEGSGQQRVRLVNTVPSAMAKLLQGGGLPESVQTVNLAGEALNEGLVEEIYRRGKVKQVNNLYGPTETTTYSSWTRVSAGQKVSIGAGVGNTQLYVLDEEMELAPLGVLGELYIGGRGVARGYWKQPGMTAERFVPNPYSGEEGVRMYRTGDLVRWREDGQLEYVGRADQQVKVRGYRIELGEIEAVLSRHEGLQESAVVVKERGGDKRLVGYAVARAGAEVTEEEVRSYLQQQLPHYMVPGQIVMLEGLAKTSNGKVDRKALPEPGRAEVGGRGPKDEVEEKIGRIWAEVLQVERVGMEEDFFRLGGHSLLATQIVARVEEQFQVRMPLRRLFESPTVAAMAAEVESGTRKRALPKVKRIIRGNSNFEQLMEDPQISR